MVPGKEKEAGGQNQGDEEGMAAHGGRERHKPVYNRGRERYLRNLFLMSGVCCHLHFHEYFQTSPGSSATFKRLSYPPPISLPSSLLSSVSGCLTTSLLPPATPDLPACHSCTAHRLPLGLQLQSVSTKRSKHKSSAP